MKGACIGFTTRGCALAVRIADALGDGWEAYGKTSGDPGGSIPVTGTLREWTEKAFSGSDALVFVGATGIAVRAVAPFLRGKTEDPAVVTVDELGRFSVSLLSGHIGGCNVLAERVAETIGAVPVITTATDINGLFSVDEFAARRDLTIDDMTIAKEVSAALLEGRPVGFLSDYPVSGDVPGCLEASPAGDLGILITSSPSRSPFGRTLRLIPRNLAVGVGCRRGTPKDTIARRVEEVLEANGLSAKGLKAMVSIDIKSDEEGLLEFCSAYGIVSVFLSAGELASVPGKFRESEFVDGITGVGNVCERAAASFGELVVGRDAADGVTVAVSRMPTGISFGGMI
ncbi:MAG: cobalamin biosynthesis protein [Candidatus Methanomethylophilaceae archaeon]|jgi:cobalt-precorrin 5A hydrolase|nr:cobalamin biosynthesis protein [Candidatus Methanomethylophilaceae archaeon]NLF33936.1 cobalamin biosynthesis protein CbiG [Thermoplasmatales archaeon]